MVSKWQILLWKPGFYIVKFDAKVLIIDSCYNYKPENNKFHETKLILVSDLEGFHYVFACAT